MNVHRRLLFVALGIAHAIVPPAQAIVIATSKGIGADAEVRDHQPTTNFGASTELATRVLDTFPTGNANDGGDRFSAMYMKFDLTGQTALPDQSTSVRLTYRNTNLTPNRLTDTTPPGDNTAFRTGLAFYGLDRDHAGNNWAEATINYITAPGIITDNDNGTKDYDFADPDGAGALRAPITPLGVALFPAPGLQNRLPVGGALVFSNDALNTFLTASLNAGKTSVTIIASIVHDGKVPVNDWRNFNYLFNPKEMLTLLTDTTYDSDTTNPSDPLGSPWSGQSNVANASGFSPFSPQLVMTIGGDFNMDDSVGTADYVVWRKTIGSQSAYNTWRANFGQAAGSGAAVGPISTAVPEPGSTMLLIMGVGLVCCRRARKLPH